MNAAFAPRFAPVQPGLPARQYRYSDLPGHLHEIELVGMEIEAYHRTFGYCLYTQEVLACLSRFLKGKRVLDAGSGSGWLSAQLTDEGVNVTACDRVDYRDVSNRGGYAIHDVYRLDVCDDALNLLPGDFDAVLLVWPPYRSEFAAKVLRSLRPGTTVIYEGEGRGGNAADQDFFDYREQAFVHNEIFSRLLNCHHRRFPAMNDRWWVGVKG